MFTFAKMQIVAATCLLFVCVIHAVDRETESPPRPFNKFGDRSRRSASRPYGYHYKPIEPTAWNDADVGAEHAPDSSVDGYSQTYWSIVKQAAGKHPPPPPPPPPPSSSSPPPSWSAYKQTTLYVPVFDVADFDRSSPPPTPDTDTFCKQSALIVLAVSMKKPASGNATGRDDDEPDDVVLLLVDRELDIVAELRVINPQSFARTDADNNVSGDEFPSDASPPPPPSKTVHGADRKSAYKIVGDENDNAAA